MTTTVSLDELKTSIKLEDGVDSITEWAKQLRNPDNEQIDRTNVYKALENGSPSWLYDIIEKKVKTSRKRNPDFWREYDRTQ